MSVETSAQKTDLGLFSERYELRNIQRHNKWEVDFKKNFETVAKTIADNITENLKTILNKRLEDSFKPIINLVQPLKLKYSFKISDLETAKKIEELAGDSAKLAPLSEWFPRLTDDKDRDFEFQYFQPFFQEIGGKAMDQLFKNIDLINKSEKNIVLKYSCPPWHDNEYDLKFWFEPAEEVEEDSNSAVNDWYNWATQKYQEGLSIIAKETSSIVPKTTSPVNQGYESF